MKRGVWFAMCSATRAIEVAALVDKLGLLEDEKPRVDGDTLIIDVDNDLDGPGTLTIFLSKAPHVVIEARELVERKGADRADRADIAKLDARYELSFALRQADAIYNTLIDVAARLKSLCGGVVYNQVNGAFMDLR
jgi:hypothetical protein